MFYTKGEEKEKEELCLRASQVKGTKTKHVKTLNIRLLLSNLSFQILKDDKYRTCLAWGCSLCNQTTTVTDWLVKAIIKNYHQADPQTSNNFTIY